MLSVSTTYALLIALMSPGASSPATDTLLSVNGGPIVVPVTTPEIVPPPKSAIQPSGLVVRFASDEIDEAARHMLAGRSSSAPWSAYTGLGIADPSAADRAVADTVRKPRRKAFEYSDGYNQRLMIHKWLSWTMLPLFGAAYVTGDELLKANAAGRQPKDWARTWHAPAASATAVLFGANTITGAWNLYEGFGDPNGRKKRIVHSVLFMLASGGFAYTGTQLASEAQQSQHMREQHRNLALASMGVSTFSWLIMLIGN